MGMRGLWRDIKEDMNIDSLEARKKYEEIAEKAKDPEQVKFAITYDFKNSRKNRADLSKFYRNLKKLMKDSGARKTQSELIFDDLETAVRIKTLAQECGAYAYLNATIGLE